MNSVVLRLFNLRWFFSEILPINVTSALSQSSLSNLEHANNGCQWMFLIKDPIQ